MMRSMASLRHTDLPRAEVMVRSVNEIGAVRDDELRPRIDPPARLFLHSRVLTVHSSL